MQTLDKTAKKPTITFNFGYIKQEAKPGSWRRGYAYYREKQVNDISFTKDGVVSKVKGKFKEAYTTQLIFKPDAVKPKCDCPLEEKWCKHAVAVALECVEQNLWEEFFDLSMDDTVLPLDAEQCLGTYRFVLGGRAPKTTLIKTDDAKKSTQKAKLAQSQGKIQIGHGGKKKGHGHQHHKEAPKGIRLGIIERKTGEVITDLEPLLRAAVQREKADLADGGKSAFSEADKREFNVMQLLVKQNQLKTDDGWFLVPLNEGNTLIQLLSQVEELVDETQQRIVFESNSLNLLLAVNVSMAANVLISLHWVKQQVTGDNGKSEKKIIDAYPLEEIELFSKNIPWGLYKHKLYPLANTLSRLPKDLTRQTFTDIRDADGGKFMYEVLPELRKVVDTDLADIVDQVKLRSKPPTKHIALELVDETMSKIQARLEFSYDGVKVAYSKKNPDSPYVMVVKKDKDTAYWIKRDIQGERDAFKRLSEGGLEQMQTNLFFAEGDYAIDFYNNLLPELKEDESDPWQVNIKGSLDFLKGSKFPLKLRASIDFSESVAQFILVIDCTIGKREMSMDQVQQYLMQGKKYFFINRDEGYVEIPLATILQFGKTLQAFDAETIDTDTYKIQTYKAGLLAELIDIGIDMNFSGKFKKFWNVISSTESMEEVEVPDSVNAELRQYQKQGFNWLWFMYSYGLNGILADDMGLGKTLQTLVLMQQAKDKDGSQPSLVVCPSSIVFNWVNEARRFTPDLKVVKLTGSDRHAAYKEIKDADLVVTSYAILRRDIRALKEYNFRFAVLDESQNIKNQDSQTADASKKLTAGHRLALSGTPIENRLSELWSLFDFLMPGFLYDIDEFRYRYITPIEEKGNRDAERRLKKQVFPFILRRLKQDVAKDLPAKIENILYCELTDQQQDLYLDILEKTKEEVFAQFADTGNAKKSQTSIFSALLRLRQVCCHPKLLGDDISKGLRESGKFDALKNMIQDVISEGHRVLLYSQFVEMLKVIRSWLEQKGIKYEYLTGETRDREGAVYRFNNDESIPIFLISLKAGGVGLNLTGADYVIHYDPWWNPAAEDQATDRAHRIGQNKTVFVYRLITKGTVEEKIMKLKDRKRDLVDSIIAADRSVGKMLTFDDLKEILSSDF
ncbi:MAG: SNF2-related protein [Vampirovibrionales bacterium]|nr:SNF2-related protein [Vampirovibrionales bacterium]